MLNRLSNMRFGQVIPVTHVEWVGTEPNRYANFVGRDVTPETAARTLVDTLNGLGVYLCRKIPVEVERKLPHLVPDMQFLMSMGKKIRDTFLQHVSDYTVPKKPKEVSLGAQLENCTALCIVDEAGRNYIVTGDDCQQLVALNQQEQRIMAKACRRKRDVERGDYQHTDKDLATLQEIGRKSKQLHATLVAKGKASDQEILLKVKEFNTFEGKQFGQLYHGKRLNIQDFEIRPRTPV